MPPSIVIPVRLTPHLAEALNAICKEAGTARSDEILKVICHHISRPDLAQNAPPGRPSNTRTPVAVAHMKPIKIARETVE